MTELAPATLQRLAYAHRASKDRPATVRVDGAAIEVQFNPATLKISRRNNVDRGGVTAQTQKRQHPSQEGATLAFDLEFDTSEQGSVGARVSVRDWTALLRQFVEPPETKPGDPPPAVRFAWGALIFDGTIDQVTEDLDHFAPDGTPLRAKVGVSIAEQNFQYEANKQGAGNKTAASATTPGERPRGSTPGSSGTDRPDRVVEAQDGESTQQLLARLGLDPEAWRGAMTGLDSPVALPAGTPVQLGPEVRSASTPGATAGFAAGSAPRSVAGLAAALGQPDRGVIPVPPPGVGTSAASAGFALSAAGGVAAATNAVAAADTSDAVAAARAGFAVPRADAGVQPYRTVDLRATTYGRAVPLRARAAPSASAGGSVAARARRAPVPPTGGSAPPWERLPPATRP